MGDLIQDMPAPAYSRVTPPRDNLTPDEVRECQVWAQTHYTAGQPINKWWHPAVIAECLRIAAHDQRGG